LFFGHLSEVLGRRKSMLLAMGVCLVSIHAWAFGTSIMVLLVGSCLMQAGGQGAFGVIPAHLNELSPDAVRSLFPGFVYQLGALGASPAVSLEFLLRNRLGYGWALTVFESCTIAALILLLAFGPEKRGRSFRGSILA
jgi:SHS family lactate transporter-like MFS transporter